MIWLYLFAFIVAFLIVFGGFVRLTRSGLSIVEWEPVSGVIPPRGDKAWDALGIRSFRDPFSAALVFGCARAARTATPLV